MLPRAWSEPRPSPDQAVKRPVVRALYAGPMSSPWWQHAVIYQIYPRSFAESGGTERGVGNLRGIIDRLDHLVWLGVDAVWLSPVFASPMADFGYDISDFCAIDPTFVFSSRRRHTR